MNLPVFGLAGAMFAIGLAGFRGFERSAASDIRDKLAGPNPSVTVRVSADLGLLNGDLRRVTIDARHFSAAGLPLFTEPGLPKDGRVRTLRLALSDFSLRGLRVEKLAAEIPDCRFDLELALGRRRIRLSKSGEGPGEVTILAKDLESFILAKFHEVRSVAVRVADGRIHVDGHGQFLIFDTDFAIDAVLTPVSGSQLELSDAKITFDGQPTDDAARKAVLDTLNPVVDLDKDLRLHGAISVTRVQLEDGKVRAYGTTRIPDAER